MHVVTNEQMNVPPNFYIKIDLSSDSAATKKERAAMTTSLVFEISPHMYISTLAGGFFADLLQMIIDEEILSGDWS